MGFGKSERKLAETLKMLRESKSITAEEMASKLGVSNDTVWHFESCRRGIRIGLFYRWCEVVDASPSRVLRETYGCQNGNSQQFDVVKATPDH